MITALCVLALVVVVLALVGACVQMTQSPLMWVFHLSCGTVGFCFELIGKLFAAIVEGFTQS